jgi:hypothetical protein
VTGQGRKRRGRDTEHLVAAWLAENGWPDAHATGAGTPGPDVLGVPWDVEVKARRGLDLGALLRQLAARRTDRLGIGVIRLDGAGPTTLGDWPVVMTLADFARLTRTTLDPRTTTPTERNSHGIPE